jgi:hypothetical protein
MPAYVNANNAFSTLAGNISAADLSFTLTAGGSFPIVAAGDWSFVTFQDTANNIEIMKVTAHGDGANSFTCVRAQEGTVARAWIAGDFVDCRFTAGTVASVDGVQTLTNKTLILPVIKFADGSLGAPGITWAAELTTGFARLAATVMAAVVNTVNVMQWEPGAVSVGVPLLNMPVNGQITFPNNLGVPWTALHGNSSNNLYVGHGGWLSTFIFGGGVQGIQVTATGVAFSLPVTGITAAMVGLANVINAHQIINLRPATEIYLGWNGTLEVQVGGTYYGNTWPISISGNAATATNATNAATAANANAVNNISGWNYSDRGHNPGYVWASDGNPGDQFLASPGVLSVNYANSANFANTAGSANTANSAANGGVNSVNGILGPVNIVGGGGILVEVLGNTITISRSTGDGI